MKSFLGQWTGQSDGGTYIFVNINQSENKISGRYSAFEFILLNDENLPVWSWSTFQGQINPNNTISGEASPPTIHHHPSGAMLSDDELTAIKKTGGVSYPNATHFNGAILDGKLEITWKSHYDNSTREDTVILKKETRGSSKIKSTSLSWSQFKEFTLKQNDGLIYRGQARHWRLQTSFHRTGHADIIDYLDNKVPQLEHHINSYSEHIYNRNDDHSLGALLNLAQHHGYPTPLLDWTRSPYVAAFFAFNNRGALKKNGHATIFIFDEEEWAGISGKVAQLRVPSPVVKAVELPGFGNARALPQQAVTMYSNIDDIETIIIENEKTEGQYLRAVSIPASEANRVMRDLGMMGLSWGSLFPGLDGICKQLSNRHFG